MNSRYIIGVDGGGTKTAFVLATRDGQKVAEVTLPRSNPADIGLDGTAAVLSAGITQLLAKGGTTQSKVDAAFAGIAGVCSNDGYINYIEDIMASLLPSSKVAVGSDGHNPLYAAFPHSDGVAVICGTGSSCFVKKGAEIYRIGGYGLFDGNGNGYEIGRRVISHALRALDGRDEPSPLASAAEAQYGGKLIEGLGEIIEKGRSYIASYAKLAFDWFDADEYAAGIVRDSMSFVAELITSAGRYFDGGYSVAITGSVGCNDISLSILRDLCKGSGADIFRLEAAPVMGAVARAAELQ